MWFVIQQTLPPGHTSGKPLLMTFPPTESVAPLIPDACGVLRAAHRGWRQCSILESAPTAKAREPGAAGLRQSTV